MVEKPDGSVSIVYYFEGSNDSLSDVLKASGLLGFPIKHIEDSDLPASRVDREYWKANPIPIGGKVDIDTAKKQVDVDAAAVDQAEKDAVLAKLKISQEELDKLNGVK